MLSKKQVVDVLTNLIEKHTGTDQWAFRKALDAVQRQVSELGILGALSNSVMIPDVFPRMTSSARSDIVSLITRVASATSESIPSVSFFRKNDDTSQKSD